MNPGPRNENIGDDAEQQAGRANDFFDLLILIYRNRRLVLLITLLFALSGCVYALLARQWYRAEVVLIPSSSGVAPGLAGKLGGLGALIGMTGIDLGDDQSREALAVLGSRDFSRAFIEEQGILPALLEKSWQNPLKKLWHRDPDDEPDVRDGVRYFLENVLDVDEDKKTELVTVSVEWTDRDTAARWANLLVGRINERMRQRALQESEANVEYLTRELDRTTLVTLQQSISNLIENEMQTLMVARSRKEIAFRVVDPATPPKLRYWPKRILVVAIATLAGLMFSFAVVMFREAMGRRVFK